jgi:putative NADH-flavin reductase
MAHVLVLGASKGVGLETVRRALGCGHRVRAFARSASRIPITDANLEVVDGDALRAADVEHALRTVDVVIQTLGVPVQQMFGPVSLFSEATRILVAAMERAATSRLIAVTGFGTGDSRQSVSLFQNLPLLYFFGGVNADKDMQEMIIRRSKLDWTIVRPGVLTSNPPGDGYRVLDRPSQWRNGRIARSDVADFLVKQICQTTHLRKTPVLIY